MSFEFLHGGGEMGARMRGFDWSATPLGNPHEWPQPLRTLVGVMLGSYQPMFIAWGPERTLLYNDGYSTMLGRKHPAALGRPFAEVWADIRSAVEPIMDRAYAGVPTCMDDIEFTMLDRYGYPEKAHFSFSYTPARDDNGRVAGMFCTCAETTEQVFTGRRLRFLLDLGDRLRQLHDPGAIVYAVAEAAGRHLRVGRAGFAEVDASGECLRIDRDWTDGRMPSLVGRWRLSELGPLASTSGTPTVRLQDASTDTGALVSSPWFGEGAIRAAIAVPLVKSGRLSAVLYAQQADPRYWRDEEEALLREAAERTWDALERARAEAALRQLNDRLEREIEERTAERDRLWELSEDLLVVADYEGHLLRVSPSWSRLLGYADATLLATPYTALVHPEDLQETLARLDEMRRLHRPVRLQTRVRSVDGTYRWTAWTLSPDPHDPVLHGVGRDVHEEKLALQELAAANRQLVLQFEERERVEATLRQMQRLEAVGQLTSGVAHDFNNLLTVVLGNITALKRSLPDPEHQRRLDMMRVAAERGAKLTGQLLAFSRNLRLEPKPVALNAAISGMRDLILSTTGGTVNVVLDLQPDLWSALVDPTQMELVVLNLAINARDAMSEGGTLTVRTANVVRSAAPARQEEPAPGEYVMVSVSDTGTGMTPDVLAKAFEPFFTTKEVGRGSGLGLSQVLGFAKQSGGGVCVSSHEGRGTTVEVYLPRAAAEVMPSVPAEIPSDRAVLQGGRPPLVLLVDDDSAVREVAAYMLEDLGYGVVQAGSGGAALDLIGRDPEIDLLLVDFAMPGMNGAELAREARTKRPGLPIVFVTGYADFAALKDVPQDRIVQKPMDEEELARKLRWALGTAGVAGERA